MLNFYLRRWSILIIFATTFSAQTLAGLRDGIRMWRDHNGVLNISNVIPPAQNKIKIRTSINATAATTTATPKIAAAAAATPPASPIPPPPKPNQQLSNNIYFYVDKLGVRHFTNIPSGAQNYQVALRLNFNVPSPAYNTPLINSPLTTRRSVYDNIVAEAAQAYQVEQSLIQAVIHTESAFNHMAVSPKGATGLMQLMPGTARRYGVNDAFNPSENVHGGVRYLKDLLEMFDNNLSLALAAYNAGENAVARYGGIPPYTETNNYVQRVLSLHNQYRNQ